MDKKEQDCLEEKDLNKKEDARLYKDDPWNGPSCPWQVLRMKNKSWRISLTPELTREGELWSCAER